MGLWGIIFNRIYIRWKILLGLGSAFWISLCFHDAFHVDPVTKLYYSDSDEYKWMTHVAEEEIIPDAIGREDDIKFPNEKVNFGTYLIFWNVLTFVMAFTACAIGKVAIFRWWKFKNRYSSNITDVSFPESLEAITKRNSSSKIPVMLPFKSAATTTHESANETCEKGTQITRNPSFSTIDEDSSGFLKASSTSIDLSVTSSKEHQHMEKQCAKLRDEMIWVQANSLKEHAALSRKLELVTKEKRDLVRQLTTAQKENRAAKMHLEELLTEKTMLIKRLECATKEFKTNTKSKKLLLCKLEESQLTITSLKQEVERSTKEKEILRNRLQILDVEYRFMKERVVQYEQLGKVGCAVIDSKGMPEPKKDVIPISKEAQKIDVLDISQSQKDVQRVQMRLINLEKSLDQLKVCKWPNTKKMDTKNRRESTTKSELGESDQDQNADCFQTDSETDYNPTKCDADELRNMPDNLTDEQRRKILTSEDFSGDEYSNQLPGKDCDFERAKNIINVLKNSGTRRSDDEIPVNETTSTSQYEDDDTDDWEPPKNRFVSSSTAFRKFLRSMGHLDRNQRKCTLPSNFF